MAIRFGLMSLINCLVAATIAACGGAESSSASESAATADASAAVAAPSALETGATATVLSDAEKAVLNTARGSTASRPISAVSQPASTSTPRTTTTTTTTTPPSSAVVSGSSLAEEEFTGPFASWIDVKRDYGAKGDGVTDDSSALQAALTEVGTPGRRSVMYLPAGKYRVTRTLELRSKRGLSIVGESPENTSLEWQGPAAGTLLDIYAVSYAKVSRLTFDGAGTAQALIYPSYQYPNGGFDFPTHLEYSDLNLRNASFCIRGGKMRGGVAEVVLKRIRATRCAQAAISIQDWNTLDWWVWDSTFEDNGHGITNTMGADPGTKGAGNFHVYRSTFLRSAQADVSTYHASFFSVQDSVSQGSRQFFRSFGPQSATVNVVLQRNRVIDSGDVPVQIETPGPLMLLDNEFRTTGAAVKARLVTPQLDILSVGNRFTVATPMDLSTTDRTRLRVTEVDNTTVTPAAISSTVPGPVPFAPKVSRRVFDVAKPVNADTIQAAIDAAVASGQRRAVVHIPQGAHDIARTLLVPANATIQIVGDGFTGDVNGSALFWSGAAGGTLMRIAGPTKAIVRDLHLHGRQKAAAVLKIDGVDQPAARLNLEQMSMHEMMSATHTIDLDGLSNALVQARGLYYYDNLKGTAIRVRGRPGGASAFNIFGGLSSNNRNAFRLEDGTAFLQGHWYEGTSEQFLKLQGSGNFTLQSALSAPDGYPRHDHPTLASIETQDFNGRASFLSSQVRGFFKASGAPSNETSFAGGMIWTLNAAPVQSEGTPNLSVVGSHVFRMYTGSHVYSQLPPTGDQSADRLRRMLAQSRQTRHLPLQELTDGITDLRLHRVGIFQGGTIGLHVTP